MGAGLGVGELDDDGVGDNEETGEAVGETPGETAGINKDLVQVSDLILSAV